MSFITYLKERWYQPFIVLFTLFTIEVFLLTQSTAPWFGIYVAFVLITGYLAGAAIDFLRIRKYVTDLQSKVSGLDKKYVLYELLDRDGRQEETALNEVFFEMEQSMNSFVNEAVSNNKDYKEYIETWVHEIKIPIAAAKMIIANHPESNNGISAEIERIEYFVEQALYYARSNTVEKDYLIRETALETVVNSVILSKRNIIRGRKISVNIHDLTGVTVFSDKKWLEFLIGQIVENSIKYSVCDGRRNPFIEIWAEKGINSVKLSIRDNGIGMIETEVEDAFQKGFTGSNGRIGKASTGIGLYLCKKLCSKLEHNITLESGLDKGTTVSIIFAKSSMTEI